MLRDVPDEAMPELFDVRNCHRVKHIITTANAIVVGCPFSPQIQKDAELHRTPHGVFPNGWYDAASLSTPMTFSSFSPSEDQQSPPLLGSFSFVRVLLNEKHRTAKCWLRHTLAHVCGSLRRPRNSKPRL